MKYVYAARKNDQKAIGEYSEQLTEFTFEELVERYNREARCGIVGVHRQALYLIALRKEFLLRLEQSPIVIEDRCVIDLTTEIDIVYDEDGICHLRPKNS